MERSGVTGETRLQTTQGIRTARELASLPEPQTCSRGREKVVHLHTSLGYTLRGAANQFIVTPTEARPVSSLVPGDEVSLFAPETEESEFPLPMEERHVWGHIMGWAQATAQPVVVGKNEAPESYRFVRLWFDTEELADLYLERINDLHRWRKRPQIVHTKMGSRYEISSYHLRTLLEVWGWSGTEHVPQIVWEGDNEVRAAYLSSLFTACARVVPKPMIVLRTNPRVLPAIQIVLSAFRIPARIVTKVGFGPHGRRPDTTLVIEGKSACNRFACEINFQTDELRSSLDSVLDEVEDEPLRNRVVSVVPEGYDEVFVPIENGYWSCNGLLIHS